LVKHVFQLRFAPVLIGTRGYLLEILAVSLPKLATYLVLLPSCPFAMELWGIVMNFNTMLPTSTLSILAHYYWIRYFKYLAIYVKFAPKSWMVI